MLFMLLHNVGIARNNGLPTVYAVVKDYQSAIVAIAQYTLI